MGSYYIYREPDYGPSTSRSNGYQTRETAPSPSHLSHPSRRPSTPSRHPSHRPISPLGTSRFERPYIPPSLTPTRIAERNAPVSLSSFYSRNLDTPRRRAPPRPNLSRYRGGESSRRPSSSRGYGKDLSTLGGGYDGSGYGGVYARESLSRRQTDFSRDAYGESSARRSPADVLGGPRGSTAASSRGMVSGTRREREYTPLREEYRSYAPFGGYDSVGLRGQGRRRDDDGGRRYY